MKGSSLGRPVVVCTEYKGVFFGYASDTSGDTIVLKRCRNVVYWPPEQHGFIGLATAGPMNGSKVGPAASKVELRKVICVLSVSKEAAEKWEGEPWS